MLQAGRGCGGRNVAHGIKSATTASLRTGGERDLARELRLGMLIRQAVDADLDAILAIHNDAILNSAAIWDDDPVDRAEREVWLATRAREGNPVLVAVDGATTVGYATYAQWRSKRGYRHTVEDSVYVAASHQGRGLGRTLLTRLIEHAREAGHHVMLADIESSNAASIRLHESLGFIRAGQLDEIGHKFDRWLDLTILSLRL
jgi:L-amino acid N-acyltransferase